jgi:hypothetical protein
MAFARGKNSLAISDRSGMAFPYTEMVREWNGSLVHYSEYEAKHPQLEPKPRGADPQGLQNARPARTEPAVARILDENPLTATSGSTTISVYEDNHGRSTGNTVRFRNGETFFAITDLNNASGFTITVTDANNYTFNSTDTANGSGKFGGGSISAGPVTLTA